MDWNLLGIYLLALCAAGSGAAALMVHNEVKKLDTKLERLQERVDIEGAAEDAVTKYAEGLGKDLRAMTDRVDAVENGVDELRKDVDKLRKDVDEFPIDQLGAVYESEKQFQEGLSSILNYFGPAKGDNKQ